MFKMLGLFLLIGVISILGLSCGGGTSSALQLSTGTNLCSDGIYNNGEEGLDCGGSCSNSCTFTSKSGIISANETWSGNIRVADDVVVASGVTLTIAPGSVVKFQGNRDYKNKKRPRLDTDGGIIKAVGTKDQMIWFTSDATTPMQNDWGTIRIQNSDNSELKYVIVEYANLGIELLNSSCPISYSIIRWNAMEGMFLAYSSSSISYNTLYSNGYHEIVLEYENSDVQIKNNYFKTGEVALYVMIESSANIENNYFKNYTQDGGGAIFINGSQAAISNNTFDNVVSTVLPDPSSTVTESGSQSVTGGTPPQYDYSDIQNNTLNYIIGSESDPYDYVYDTEDSTRKIINRVGEGLGFGYVIAAGEGYVWRQVHGGLVRIDPTSGTQVSLSNNAITLRNIAGLAHDGQNLWAFDTSQRIIYKLETDESTFNVLSQVAIPSTYVVEAGPLGSLLAADSTYLYLSSSDGVYKLTKSGSYVETLPLPTSYSPIAFDGTYFWTEGGCSKGLCKHNTSGELVGEIYQVAEATAALTWDGQYLWTLQKTCETWNDDKMFQIEVLDDSL